MSADREIGTCDSCGKFTGLSREYFRYPEIKCECHSPYHFEIVRYCKDCLPREPLETTVTIKTSELKRLVRVPDTGIDDLSDGYHTFRELYHHRAILFAVICNDHKELAWKSLQHHDGKKMYDGMFVVGIETPQGQATYHYDVDPYWDIFNVKELPKAPEWDGHTPDQAIARIQGLIGKK